MSVEFVLIYRPHPVYVYHKVHTGTVYTWSTAVYVPSFEIGVRTPPLPLQQANVPLSPEPRGGGHTRLRVRGWGSPDSDDLRKSLALCPLRGMYLYIYFFWGGEGRLRLLSVIFHRRCSIVLIVVLEEGVTGTYFMLPEPYLGQIHRF
jgi:hypothetical protein